MKKSFLIVIAIIVGVCWSVGAWGQTPFTATYTFGSDGNVLSFAYNGTSYAGITMSNINKVGVTTSSSSGNFRATAWPTASSPDAGKYIGFTITAASGYKFTVNTINFGIGRSGTGTRDTEWRGSADSYAALINNYTTLNSQLNNNYGVLNNPDENISWTGNVLTLGSSYADLTSSAGFRMYMYNAEAGTGTAGLQGTITITGTFEAAASTPTITLSETNLTGFTYEEGSGPSTEQTFTVSGTNLTNDISIAASTNYEISKTSGSGYTSPLTFTQSGGTVNATTVYVRLKSGLSEGTYNDEDINATSSGATSKAVECDGSVTAVGGGGACASDLIISEYGEGSTGNSKYVEIYNGTGSSVTLSNYRIWTISNGGTWPESTYDFTTGSLADGETLVIANNSTDVPGADELNAICSWNGDDAVGLAKNDGGWILIDAVGEDGSDPGSGWAVAGTSNATVDRRLTRKQTVVSGNTDWDASRGTTVDNSEWILSSYSSGSAIDGHTMTCGPTITVTPATLTGLNYIFGNGPSAEQSFSISGTNLTANISITPPTNYEISTGTGGSFVASNPITLTQSGGTVSSTTIYVRLKSGLSAGTYNSETITATSTDATDKTVTCSGTVSTPDVTASVASLTGFTYIYGNGPSTSQNFTVSGTNLSNNLVVTAPTNYEVSTSSGSGYGATVTLTPVSNAVASTTIYVRLKAGLAVGAYNLENITVSSTGATNETVACSGDVVLAPVTGLTVGCTSNTTAEITWTAPAGTYDGVVIAFRNDPANPPHTISDGTNPATISADANFGDGYEFGIAFPPSSYVVYKGTGTSVTVTGLTAGETYKVKAYTYSGTNWLLNADCPTVTVSNVGLSNVTLANNTDSDAQSALIWTNPSGACFDEVLVVCKHGSAVTTNPSGDGSSYTANAAFSSGTDIGTNEYAVYKGTGSSVTITGLTNDDTYYAKIFTRKGSEWSSGVQLILYPAAVTVLEYGDLAIVAVNTNQANGDEISFVSFKSIATGTSIDFTDNGYERENANQWGDTEGTIRITRTGGTISAGTVITIVGEDGGANPTWVTDFNIYIGGVNDNANWTLSSLNGSSSFNMNSTDQIWIMQGGNWTNGAGSHDATYSGNVLFGWTAIAWKTSCCWAPGSSEGTKGSTIYPGCECATTNVLGKTYVDKVKYTGPTDAANRTEWIGRINDPDNWTDYSSNALFDAGSPAYRTSGASWTIDAGALTAGKWAGYKSSGWCDCANWFSLKVPEATTNVEIPAHVVDRFDVVLSAHVDSLAVCNDLTILGRVYNVAGASLDVNGDMFVNGGSVFFNTNAITLDVAGDITAVESDSLRLGKAELRLNGTGAQLVAIEGASLETLNLNSLTISGTGTKTISDNLDIATNLTVDNSNLNFNTAGSSLSIDGNLTLQNAATMGDDCKTNLDITLSTTDSQVLRGSGNAIKARRIFADKTNCNLSLSSTGGRTDLFIGEYGDFNMTGTSVFTDNGGIIQTDDDLYLGGDATSNYNLTGIVRFTGANVTGQMLLADETGTGLISADLQTLNVKGGNLEIMPAAGSATLTIKDDYLVENTGTADANGNNLNIGGDYYVNADAAFDASLITITMNGAANQNLSANNSVETFGTLVINKAGGALILDDNIEANSLNLTSGLITTGTNRVFVSNATPANLSNYSTSSYINGNLRRAVNASGNYDMPVGSATNYELANVDLNSSTGLTYLDVNFGTIGTPLNISSLGLTVNSTLVETLLDAGIWTITPNAGMTAVNYDIGLSMRGATNAGADPEQHTIVKRANSSSDWTLQGNHNNATQSIAGGVVYAYRSNIAAFSDFAIAKNNSNTLPVELISFAAKCNNNDVELVWTTASEINNDYFEVQKSVDGNLWYYIGTVKGAGNSTTINSYSFVDKENSANAYYRLRQVDFDGKFEYSQVIFSNCNQNAEVNLIVYPNPVSDYLNVMVENWKSEKIYWEIVNTTGQVVLKGNFKPVDSYFAEQINMSELKPGMYVVRFMDDDNLIIRKADKK